ncbi:DegT/DnrJ/EryC1/StrS family aminotransferase [Algoriphagus algorifonticola]|uniref:DegT/DnrJ/EryC1/StrS family aminotransferase n=1 Tax=Algoriphagus algorifonticola TaxID=2593007 RepID=UPI0011A2BCD5|nr:DegT/DnrJ/EryC1/StrS family aminotransferase [Algoriphagus algorifonticola]
MIPVTKPYLPSLEEYNLYLQSIWKRQWLTNNGPLVNELEIKVNEYLNTKYFLYLGNGTIALQIALKALKVSGEIITTPFSYVATTSAIVWENCKPVFVDIHPDTFNIDPDKIEKAITSNTTAILATHVYGIPCDLEKIEQIAQKHNLKVIYDAAHCFGVRVNKKSIFEFGDISTVSFHATKLFHTIEGGGVFTKDNALFREMTLNRNFGHDGPEVFSGLGINGKNSEFHAAMGLVNLRKIDEIIAKRKSLTEHYNYRLKDLNLQRPKIKYGIDYNYGYYPILFDSHDMMKKCLEKLNRSQVFPRRYFYPSLDTLPYVKKANVPICDDISQRVLCLPLYYELSFEEVDLICRIMHTAFN